MVLFKKTHPTKLDLTITYFYFFTLFIVLFFFSENNPLFNSTLMNPNEGINYLIVLWMIINILHLKLIKTSFKISYNPLLLGYLIFLIAVFLFTRQGVLSILLFFFLYLIFNKNINYVKKIIYLLPLIILLTILIQYLQSFGEYETARINTVLSLEASTRSDQKRIDLIEFGINGFLNYPYGHGLGSFIDDNEFDRVSHNFYVAIMYQLGIFGLIPVVYIILKAIINIFKSSNSRNRLVLSTNLIAIIFFFQILFIGALGKAGIYVVSAWVLSNNNLFKISKKSYKKKNFKHV
jgi:O-antigen ligase